jgi:LSD1 subclass zinc finger protein
MYVMEIEKIMLLKQELLDILVCPICKTPVMPTPVAAGLKCATCRRIYPICEGVPKMLSETATIISE